MKPQLVFLLLLAAGLADPAAAPAKEWARKMFETTSHDFGTMARGAKAVFDFELQNIYEEEIHVASVRSSCGCTSPSIIQPLLKTWEKGAIRCQFNTSSFLGPKTATITVVIDQPFPAEVQLTVRGYIRSDVVVHPGYVDLGEVDAGTGVERRLDVSYAGRIDWKILHVETPGDYVDVQLRQTERSGNRVGYQMSVRLTEDAPVGYVANQLYIVTNDRQLQKIPVAISGRVLPHVTVSPSLLALGTLPPGQSVTKQLLVRSRQPFEVVDLQADSPQLHFVLPSGAKTLHVIPVTFTAGEAPGEMATQILIKTSLGEGAEVRCTATATVRGDRTSGGATD